MKEEISKALKSDNRLPYYMRYGIIEVGTGKNKKYITVKYKCSGDFRSRYFQFSLKFITCKMFVFRRKTPLSLI